MYRNLHDLKPDSRLLDYTLDKHKTNSQTRMDGGLYLISMSNVCLIGFGDATCANRQRQMRDMPF